MDIKSAADMFEYAKKNLVKAGIGRSLPDRLEAAASRGVTELFEHTVSDEQIRELNKLGYDIEIGNWIIDNDGYEVRIYFGKDASGKYENPIADFYRLVKEKKIEAYEYTDDRERNRFLEKWKQAHGDIPCPPELKLYIGIPDGPGAFYEWYEEFLYQPAVSDVKRLVDRVMGQIDTKQIV